MKTIGRHLIAEYYRCDIALLDDIGRLRYHMLTAAERIGANVMSDTFNRFTPQGVSGTVVISESHLSIHTWPEFGYVAVDIYTCGGLDPRPGFEYLGRALGATSCRMQEILRGLPDDLQSPGPLVPEDVRVITRMAEPIELRPVEPQVARVE
jgi:S-adenosylmethionine decarboxylase